MTKLFINMSVMTLFMLMSANTATAEIIVSAPDHFTLKHQAVSADAPEVVWQNLIIPATWWSSEHTYSGDAANMSLNPEAGGMWREDWNQGSVHHGWVLYAKPNEMLRLDAPFGPLQELAVQCVWTIVIKPEGTGSEITFHFVANGSAQSKLDELAPAVDFVKSQAMKRLSRPVSRVLK